MSTLYVDLHVLQTLPPGNVNRDQSGRPKTATYGGVERARVSSQAWKRATRAIFETSVAEAERGLRTRRLPGELAKRLSAADPSLTPEDVDARVKVALAALGLSVQKRAARPAKKSDENSEPSAPDPELTEYLVFLSNRQIDRIANLLVENPRPRPAEIRQAADLDHGIEVGLFGRMVADAADLRVDAACQVAHAISTHAVRTQFDYFTAVDDIAVDDETGAGMIGTVEFNSSTLYRYATVNLTQLVENLGSAEAALAGLRAFVDAFALSMPTGKQNTFANRTTPDAVVAMGRLGRPVNLVGAFEDAIRDTGHGYIEASAQALATHAAEVNGAFGPAPEFTVVSRASNRTSALDALGERLPFSDLVDRVVEQTGRLITDSDS